MLIRDTQEYKDLVKLQELHDTYKKHVIDSSRRCNGYDTYICKGCGLPFEKEHGNVHEDMPAVYHAYNHQHSRKFVSSVPAAQFARMLDIELQREEVRGDIVNYRMQQLKDQLPIAEYHQAMAKSTLLNAEDIYLFATKILNQPATDLYAAMVRGLTTPAQGYHNRYAQQGYARGLLAWHQFFKTKPDKSVFKTAVTKIDIDDRALWSRLAGLQMATSYRFKTVTGAIRSYLLLRDKDKKRYNDIAWMTKIFGEQPTIVLMYYKDTGRLLAPLKGEDAVVKSRLIDSCVTPTADDQAAMGDVYPMVYGSGSDKLDRIDSISSRTWRAALCPTFEDFLRREESYTAGDELQHTCNWDGYRGFKEDLDEDI